MLQGMTAHYLTHSTFPLKAGDTCLVHAAAGGAGGLIVQMAKNLGARVFGTVSTAEKAEIARDAGADEVILYTEQEFDVEARRLTGGRGVDVVYDSVGKTTFDKSLNSLRPRGTLALFGQSSGPVQGFEPDDSQWQGLALPHASQPGALPAERARNCCGAPAMSCNAVDAGKLRLRIDRTYPLADAARRIAIWNPERPPANFSSPSGEPPSHEAADQGDARLRAARHHHRHSSFPASICAASCSSSCNRPLSAPTSSRTWRASVVIDTLNRRRDVPLREAAADPDLKLRLLNLLRSLNGVLSIDVVSADTGR